VGARNGAERVKREAGPGVDSLIPAWKKQKAGREKRQAVRVRVWT
jgi:hypothetical protein